MLADRSSAKEDTMFIGNMVTEAIPARVYSLYKISVSKKDMTRADVQGQMEPPGIYEASSSYFAAILRAATELKLVEVQDNIIVPLIPREQMQDIEDFRLYVISKIDTFRDEQFYKCTNTIVNMNERIYEYSSISELEMLNILSTAIGQQITEPMTRGWRFWAQFLGVGYMNDMAFLPNAYIFAKNVLRLIKLEKKREYKIDDFMTLFNQYGRILTDNLNPERNMNIALSSALRELHDNGEIELKYSSDAENRWLLYPSNESFNEQVASVVFKGVKK